MIELIHHLSSIYNKKIIPIAIPQFFLSMVCYLQQYLKFKIGIYPDQLKRLEALKENSTPPNYVRTLKEVFS